MVSMELESEIRCCEIVQANLLRKLFCQPPLKVPKDVCRNLFGVCDRKPSNALQMTQDLDERVERSSQEWNFDFFTEVPLPPGRYLWEKVRNCDVPAWYSLENPKVIHKGRQPQETIDCEDMGENAPPRGHALREKENSKLDAKLEATEKTSQESGKKRYRQTSMKDFTKVQKRRCSSRLRLKKVDKKHLKSSSQLSRPMRRERNLPNA